MLFQLTYVFLAGFSYKIHQSYELHTVSNISKYVTIHVAVINISNYKYVTFSKV